jgi:hypothetical protein
MGGGQEGVGEVHPLELAARSEEEGLSFVGAPCFGW